MTEQSGKEAAGKIFRLTAIWLLEGKSMLAERFVCAKVLWQKKLRKKVQRLRCRDQRGSMVLGRSGETGFLPTRGDFRGEQALRSSQVGRGHRPIK